MTEKQYQKLVADARRAEGRKYGFRQNTYINFKVEDGYFFCVYFQYGSARLTVKPMYADDLWWDILGEPENKDKPDSLRGTGEHSLPEEVLGLYRTEETREVEELSASFEEVFAKASDAISEFLTENPDSDVFCPDEQKMYLDPDRLLYLMALIHNGRENEVLKIIREARREGHRCAFRSGWWCDSYTFIKRWCRRTRLTERIRRKVVAYYDALIKYRAYAYMAFSFFNLYGDWPDYRLCGLIDFAVIFVVFVPLIFYWNCPQIIWIVFAIDCFFSIALDYNKKSERYYKEFNQFPLRTKIIWRLGVWISVILFYLYGFSNMISHGTSHSRPM